jgi:Co/Zn/Cd efflux system component
MTPVEKVLLRIIEDMLLAIRAAHAELDACKKAIEILSEKYVKPEDRPKAKEFLDELLVSVRQASALHDWRHETYLQVLKTYAQMIPDETETGIEVQAALEELDSVRG